MGIEVILKLFSREGLQNLFKVQGLKFKVSEKIISDNSKRIIALQDEYVKTIDSVIAFLQGKNPTLALQICQEDYLPEASRFAQLEELDWAFGTMGTQDKAKHLATLYLEDISDFIVECVDENFGFSRYAERLGRSANSFDELYEALQKEPTYIDGILLSILEEKNSQNSARINADFCTLSWKFVQRFSFGTMGEKALSEYQNCYGRWFSQYRIAFAFGCSSVSSFLILLL